MYRLIRANKGIGNALFLCKKKSAESFVFAPASIKIAGEKDDTAQRR